MSLTFVSHLECSLTGKRYEAGRIQGLSEAGRPLLVRYELAKLASTLKKSDFILCEDTRHSLKLLNNLNIKSQLIPYHKFSKSWLRIEHQSC